MPTSVTSAAETGLASSQISPDDSRKERREHRPLQTDHKDPAQKHGSLSRKLSLQLASACICYQIRLCWDWHMALCEA